MGFWDRLTGRQSRAAYARTNADLLINEPVAWIGLDSGGGAYPIGPHGPYGPWTAPAVPAVLRATSLITSPLVAAPFRVLDTAAGKPLAPPRWITDPMLLRPDERFTPQVHAEVLQSPRSLFWTEWIRSALWWGEGAFICAEDSSGQPQAGTLRVVAPQSLDTERVDGSLRWVLGEGNNRVVFDRDGYVDLGPIRYRLVVLRNPHSPVDVDGRSKGVFAMSPGAFGLADQLESYQTGQFRSGVPNGYLKITDTQRELTQEMADELKQKWLENHGGDRRSIAVLNAVTEFKPINLSPVDAALDQVKRLSIADTAFAFAIDPITLGAGLNNSATYNNIRDAWSNHRDFGISLWIAAVQDTLTPLLSGARSVAVSLDGFANPSTKERLETYQLALQVDPSGDLLNEIRSEEGRTDLPVPPRPAPPAPPAPEEES